MQLAAAVEDFIKVWGPRFPDVVETLKGVLGHLDSAMMTPGQSVLSAGLPEGFNSSGQGPQPHRQEVPMHVVSGQQRDMSPEAQGTDTASLGQGPVTARNRS